jgi:chromosome segregation ATPase
MKPAFAFHLGLRIAMLGITLVACPSNAAPDDKKIARAQQERIQRMQQAQQALEQEKAQLSAEKADMELKLRSAKLDLDRARAQERKDLARQLELDAQQKEKEKAKEALTSQLAALNADLSATRQQLQLAQQSVAQLKLSALESQKNLDSQKAALQTCDKQNLGLYQLNTDLLARYERAATQGKGLVGNLLDPFAQVRLENDGTAYRDQLDALKRVPAAVQ